MTSKSTHRREKGFIAVAMIVVFGVLILGVLIALFIVVMNNSKKVDKDVASPPAPPMAPVDNSKFAFKEYGVEITLPYILQGLTYRTEQITEYNGEKAVALYLSSPSFEGTMKKCYGKVYKTMSFGVLAKLDGKYSPPPPNTPGVGTLLKQFDNFYIASSYPNGLATCTEPKVVDKDLIFNEAHIMYAAVVDSFKTAKLVTEQ